MRDADSGRRYADILVQVRLLDGMSRWILIHIEVQGQVDNEFDERMFVYNYGNSFLPKFAVTIDWVMRLPRDLEHQLREEIVQMEMREANSCCETPIFLAKARRSSRNARENFAHFAPLREIFVFRNRN